MTGGDGEVVDEEEANARALRDDFATLTQLMQSVTRKFDQHVGKKGRLH